MTAQLSQAELLITNVAGMAPVGAFWLFALAQALKKFKNVMVNSGTALMMVTFACCASVLAMRGLEAGRFPLSNLYESILWFVLFICGAFIQLYWVAALIAGTMLLYASWLPAGQHEIKPLVPALVSYWRQIHVPPLICSYALFVIAGACGLLQLFNSGHQRSVIILTVTLLLAGAAVALGTFTDIDTWVLQSVYAGSSVVGVMASWLQLKCRHEQGVNASAAALYDEIGSRCISIGLPLLTFGIITGGLWANHAWGTYWSWDPKESMALTTWLGYAAYIHLRVYHELPAQKLSVVAVVGVLLTLLTYLGFNSLGFGGLHSYGRFK